MSIYALRRGTASDYELMWTIQRVSIGPYVDATFGWEESVQRRYFDDHFDHRKHQIILVGGVDAGFLSWERRDDHVYLGNVALLPEFQNRGVGTRVVRDVMAQAEKDGLPLRLQVLKPNPARRFYERLGFVVCGETDTHFRMARDRDPDDLARPPAERCAKGPSGRVGGLIARPTSAGGGACHPATVMW